MKLIAVLILYVVSCQAYHERCSGAYMKNLMLKCVTDSEASYSDLSDLLTSMPAKGEKGRCYRACVYQSCRFISQDGRLSKNLPTRLANILNSGIPALTQPIEKAGNYCLYATKRHHNVCDTTEDFVQCIIKKSPVRLILHNVF